LVAVDILTGDFALAAGTDDIIDIDAQVLGQAAYRRLGQHAVNKVRDRRLAAVHLAGDRVAQRLRTAGDVLRQGRTRGAYCCRALSGGRRGRTAGAYPAYRGVGGRTRTDQRARFFRGLRRGGAQGFGCFGHTGRRGGVALFVDGDQRVVHQHGVAFGGMQFGDDAGERAGKLNQRLRGFDFYEHLVDLDGVADLDLPCGDIRFGQAFTHIGEIKDCHFYSLASASVREGPVEGFKQLVDVRQVLGLHLGNRVWHV